MRAPHHSRTVVKYLIFVEISVENCLTFNFLASSLSYLLKLLNFTTFLDD